MRKLLSNKSSQVGFTLIELLIVIAIIVIVIAVGATSYTTVAKNSRDSQRQATLHKLQEALEEFHADHGSYPPTFGTSSYWGEGGQGQEAGRYCNENPSHDSFCCLLGDIYADNVFLGDNITHVCDEPRNSYLSSTAFFLNGDRYDPKFRPTAAASFNDTTYYKYASDGQSYVLVAPNYEGNIPSKNKFSSTSAPYYWCEMQDWIGATVSFDNAYFARSDRQKTPSATNPKNPDCSG